MAERKEQFGVWIDFPNAGTKKIIEFVISLTPKSRKEFLVSAIEEKVFDLLYGIPGVEDMLAALQSRTETGIDVVGAYRDLIQRVESRRCIEEGGEDDETEHSVISET